MADYTDLLRRAVEALPENNGASRRLVYEKARKALKDQLRAIDLPARDVTRHRLQLEDCIRAVEEQASERLFGGLSKFESATFDVPAKDVVAAPEAIEDEDIEVVDAEANEAETDELEDAGSEEATSNAGQSAAADESVAASASQSDDEVEKASSDILDESADDSLETVSVSDETDAESPMEAAEAAESSADGHLDIVSEQPMAGGLAPAKPITSIDDLIAEAETTRESVKNSTSEAAVVSAAKINGVERNTHAAMSAVREVDVDEITNARKYSDAQSTIDKAIAKLDRAASGENDELEADDEGISDASVDAAVLMSAAGQSVESEAGGGNALTIFLVLFVVLLGLVGGAGFWSWREGYIDLEALLGREQTEVVSQAEVKTPTVETPIPGNTEATAPSGTVAIPTTIDPPVAQKDEPKTELTTPVAPETVVPTAEVAPETVAPVTDATEPLRLVAEPNADENKSEDRLPTASDAVAVAGDATTEVAPAEVVNTGSQSLLLEATDDGKTGAVPFSGAVEWTRGVDEIGQPTLLAKANIPARNMQLELLIRKNADETLPASHLIEIDFTLSDSFIGGGIGRIAGVLLKNEELVQGTAMVGASARISGNSFLFAMSAADQDKNSNLALLSSRKWLDLAMLYSTGKQAIITLEKDEAAQALFKEVMEIWQQTPAPAQ